MQTQNLVKQTLSKSANIEYIRSLLEDDEPQFKHRTELATILCKNFSFFDLRGQAQQGSCLKALRELEDAGHFTLPVALKTHGDNSPKRLPEPIPLPTGVPSHAGDVQGLELILVITPEQSQTWNEIMFSEHPQGAGPFVGRQLRYLIQSEHGLLGGFGFAAAALQLSDRDEWIGWDEEGRRAYLQYVVGMNRFLLRPTIACKNLASKVMGLVLTTLPIDFEQKYGYKPLLVESFVDTSQYTGTCYRASNWIEVGKTKGRGRQGKSSQVTLSIKDIYCYPLESDFREKMGLASKDNKKKLEPLTPIAGLEGSQWAEQEFGDAPVGDKRIKDRLVNVAAAKAEMPGRAFSGVVNGNQAQTKGYYRMIDQPEDSEFTMENILAPHRQRTIQRMAGQDVVLCIQDGTDLNYNNLDQCEGLGIIGSNQTSAKSRGLHLHSTFVTDTDGLPLGILRADCTAPEPKSPEDKRSAKDIPIEEKKTYVWIEHYRDTVELSKQMPQTHLINTCDREADFFELFDEQANNPGVDLLVRAKNNRSLEDDESKLFESVSQREPSGRIQVNIPRESSRTKKSKQKARPMRPGRVATMEIRYESVKIKPPKNDKDKTPIELYVVHAREENPPEGCEAAEWFLLTTIVLTSVFDAEECLRWYCLRWRIEDWHRVLKSGCGIEKIGQATAERLRRAIAINLVIGWRIMLMTLLGREMPELPAEVLFTEIELKTLDAFAKKKCLKSPALLGDAVKLVARMGGHLGRKSDPPPGHQIMWVGYTALQHMCMGFELAEGIESG